MSRFASTPDLGTSTPVKLHYEATETDLLEAPHQHSKEPSGGATYNILGYYEGGSEEEFDGSVDSDVTTTVGSTEMSAMSSGDRLVEGDSGGEPFMLVSKPRAQAKQPKQPKQPKPTVNGTSRPRKNPVTRKESYAELQKSRTSLERIRSQIDESMVTPAAPSRKMSLRSNQTNQPNQPNKLNQQRAVSSSTVKSSPSVADTPVGSDYDRYGFKKASNYVSRAQYDAWWDDYSVYLAKRKRKWEKLMAKNGLQTTKGVAPTRFPPRSDDLRKFVRKGIPAEWRGNAWFTFARGNERLRNNRGVYDQLVDQTMDMINENTEAIEKDLHRTFPENEHFRDRDDNEESPMLQTLRRVLKCFALYKPSVGYCQSLNFIAGLLLIFMDEEKAFWMLVIICERYLPGIHELNLEGVNVHQGVLMLCLRQYLPNVWHMVVEQSDSRYVPGTNAFLYELPALSFCTTSWFMSIYIGVLPIETTLRVWDCLFYEDSQVLFQVALTIFKEMEPELQKCVSAAMAQHEDQEMLASELFQVIQNYPKRLLDANKLIDDCFKYSNFSKLSQEEVHKCKQYVIDSRGRYHSLIKKRSAIGLKEADRKELMQSSDQLEQKQIGLKSLNWNGRLNHRMRRIQQKLT